MTLLTAARLAALIPRGRAAAEASMTATCVIRRPDLDAQPVLNSAGQYEQPKTAIYAGKCELKFPSAITREVEAESQELTEQDPILKLPVETSGGIHINDVGEIIASEFDPSQVGVRFRVAGLHQQNHLTARRLPVEVTN